MDSADRPNRRTDALHCGRVSAAGEKYFITLVTKDREPWLAAAGTQDVLSAVLRTWHTKRDGRILAAMTMPDHAHVLIELGSLLTVGQVVARWKSSARRRAGFVQSFQRDFWEHRLRPEEDIEDYGLYMFLNPYRARLLKTDDTWPGWWLPDPGLFRFPCKLCGSGGPPPEWVEWPDEKFSNLAHGE